MKRSSARRRSEEEKLGYLGVSRFVGRDVMEVDEGGPFDPLDGQGEESSLYVVRQDYHDPYGLLMGCRLMSRWLDQLRNDAVALAGGFSMHDVYKRGLFEAYAGLGCILSDELSPLEVA